MFGSALLTLVATGIQDSRDGAVAFTQHAATGAKVRY